jgi:hypothetical protein
MQGGKAATTREARVGVDEDSPTGTNRLTEGRKGEEPQRNFEQKLEKITKFIVRYSAKALLMILSRA